MRFCGAPSVSTLLLAFLLSLLTLPGAAGAEKNPHLQDIEWYLDQPIDPPAEGDDKRPGLDTPGLEVGPARPEFACSAQDLEQLHHYLASCEGRGGILELLCVPGGGLSPSLPLFGGGPVSLCIQPGRSFPHIACVLHCDIEF